MPDCLPLTSFGSLLAKAPAGTPTPRGPGYAVAGSGPDCGRRAFREARGLGGGRGRPRNIVHGRGFFLVRTRRTPLGVGAAPSGRSVARLRSPCAVRESRRSGVGRDQGRKR